MANKSTPQNHVNRVAVKALCLTKNMTLMDLAEELGTNPQRLNQVLNNFYPRSGLTPRIAAFFGVPVEDLDKDPQVVFSDTPNANAA